MWRLCRTFALLAFAFSLFTMSIDVVTFLTLQYHRSYERADVMAAAVLESGIGTVVWGVIWDTIGRHLGVK